MLLAGVTEKPVILIKVTAVKGTIDLLLLLIETKTNLGIDPPKVLLVHFKTTSERFKRKGYYQRTLLIIPFFSFFLSKLQLQLVKPLTTLVISVIFKRKSLT